MEGWDKVETDIKNPTNPKINAKQISKQKPGDSGRWKTKEKGGRTLNRMSPFFSSNFLKTKLLP